MITGDLDHRHVRSRIALSEQHRDLRGA
jgi:hypothetical protein